MQKRKGLLIGVLTLALISSGAAWADTAEQGRKVMHDNDGALVSVHLVLESTATFEGETSKRETRVTTTATVIDPSGLVVTSLAASNPADMFSDMMDEGEDEGLSTRVVDVRIRLSDGTEIPGDVVLRDRDLDLAFIRPKKAPEKPLTYVDMTQAATPQALDELVVLTRLGQVGSRVLAACVDRVQAVISKPRTLYALSSLLMSNVGSPAFTLDGKPVGMVVMRLSKSRDDSEGGFGISNRMMAAVLPCAAMLKAAEQARTAQPENEKAAKPAEKPAAR